MDEQMLKDLAKNIANFCGEPPLINPSIADCGDNSVLWESYLRAWVKNWEFVQSQQ